MNDFDVIVIGTGTSGSNAAYKCRKAGMNVAVIEQGPLGGTCANRGCDPKKILYGAAQVAEISRALEDVFRFPLEVDWTRLIKFKKTFTDPVSEKRKQSFKDNDIKVFYGTASFEGRTELSVNGKKLSAGRIVIATGSRPGKIGIPGEEYITTSDIFMETERLPGEIVFIGGGYISFEFAHIASRCGARVKILQKDKDPLKKFDRDIVVMLLEASRAAGIEFIPETRPESLEKKNGRIHIKTGNGEYICDMAIHGAGRVPDIEMLKLEKAGIKADHGIKVNSFLQSVSNPSIYAVGDAASIGQPLTPVASLQGKIAAYNIINGNKKTMDYSMVPSVVFTLPPMASVGMTESQAVEKKIKYTKKILDTTGWYNSRRLGFKKTGFKILKDGSGKIIGASILYPGAEDIIDVLTLAIKTGASREDIMDMAFSYPSFTSDIKYMI